MIKTIYGRQFDSQFSDESTLKRAKRLWTKEILALSDESRAKGFEELKQLKIANDKEYQWPDVAKVIGLCRASRPSAHHLFLPEPEKVVTEEDMNRGRKALAGIKAGLGMS